MAKEQFLLPFYNEVATKREMSGIEVVDESNELKVTGDGFEVSFDHAKDQIATININKTELLTDGPVLNFWRAPTDNDFGNDLQTRALIWRKAGQNRTVTSHQVNQIDTNTLQFTYLFNLLDSTRLIANYKSIYTVYGNGEIEVDNHFKMIGGDLPEIPVMGMNLVMSHESGQMSWYGRGPHESYAYRKTTAFVNVNSDKVSNQYWAYLRQQENVNKTDVRWLKITSKDGVGLLFKGKELLEVSAHHNIMEDFLNFAN